MWRNTLLFLHIGGAIAFFGPTFTFPIFGIAAKKHGGDIKTLLRLQHLIVHRLVIVGDYLVPITGGLIILQSEGAWSPFESPNRWLLASIVLYVMLYTIATFVMIPLMKRALTMAEAGQVGPEFGAVMERQAKIGALLGLLTVVIMVLMITKPGSGFVHP